MTARLVNFIRDAGLTHFAYRSDRGISITKMIDEARKMLGTVARHIQNKADLDALEAPCRKHRR